MHYKRLQKYGKKLAVAILTSAVLLASGATVYADDTGEYLSQANTQEAEVTESTEDVATPAESESGEVESTTRNQEEQKNKATESEIQEEGKIQDVSEEQPESEVQIKEEKQPASESAAVPELNEEAQQPAVQSQEAQIAVQTQTVEAPHPGWNQSGGQTYYLDENMNRLTGWRLLGNVWYYFDNQGVMATGWRWIGGKWYYMNSAGAMQSGWFQDGQTWYYANGSGVMQKGWLNRGGTWYYLTGSGAMAEGWGNIGGTWYYFQPGNGAMQTGWGQVDGSWYYFGGDGAMKTGWINDGKRNYYLKPNGVWKNILIGVIGNNEAGAATTAAKVREMGVDAVIVTGGYDPSQYDGIIIPGGGDLDPSRYGQANTGSSNIDNVLDDRQIDAVKRSAEAGKPVLGICKGIQLVNVAFGGTLNQNIGGHMGVWHSAHVVAGGWLSGVYSGSVSVLSYHHQSIRDLAPGFQVDMRAGDGTVEAISNSAKRVYGVQFHPEQMNNDAGNRCMKQFVAICTN